MRGVVQAFHSSWEFCLHGKKDVSQHNQALTCYVEKELVGEEEHENEALEGEASCFLRQVFLESVEAGCR